MTWSRMALTLAVPLVTAIYTWNYARWAWREKAYRGAVGLFLLAVATLVVPALVLWVGG